MTKEIKSKETKKESFFSKLATLLAPIDEAVLYRGRTLAKSAEAETEKEPARRARHFPEIRPMQVMKI